MAIRVDYKEIEEVSQRVPVPLKHSENLRNFEGEVGGYPTPCDIATDDLDAWKWATHVAHQEAKACRDADAFRAFFLWNCELEGI
jgi:hypothetical protein